MVGSNFEFDNTWHVKFGIGHSMGFPFCPNVTNIDIFTGRECRNFLLRICAQLNWVSCLCKLRSAVLSYLFYNFRGYFSTDRLSSEFKIIMNIRPFRRHVSDSAPYYALLRVDALTPFLSSISWITKNALLRDYTRKSFRVQMAESYKEPWR